MTSREETISFNVGGRIFTIRRSLLDMFPHTILARSASKEWNTEAENQPIFLDRDTERFRYCLDYMREGKVELPPTESRGAFLKELEYFGFEAVDPNTVVSGLLGIHAIKCLLLCEQKLDQSLTDMEERRNHARAAYELLRMCQGCNYLNLKIYSSNSSNISNTEKKIDLFHFCHHIKPNLIKEYLTPYGLQLLSCEKNKKHWRIQLALSD